MNTPIKLGGFALVAALVLRGAYGLGELTGPASPAPDPAHGDDHRAAASPATRTGQLPAGGLLIAQDGYRFQLMSGGAAAGTPEEFAFRILGPDGSPVTDFAPTHDKRMHLIVVRRDLAALAGNQSPAG